MQPSCWATWLLKPDDRAARACSSRLAEQQQPEKGTETGEWLGGLTTAVNVIPIRDGYAASSRYASKPSFPSIIIDSTRVYLVCFPYIRQNSAMRSLMR